LSEKKPDLGRNPFSDEIAANNALTAAAVTIVGKPNPRDPDSDWFRQQSSVAETGISKIARLPGFMEIRFAPSIPARKSPSELLNAVEKSEIKTFGWPIAVTLQNRPEYRPRPSEHGIKAEISIPESTMTGRYSYDYWALTHEGDFYLLQSLFEDMRTEKAIFFNTRIVRAAEALLFGASLYGNLGLSPETLIKVRVRHSGLKGRTLASSSPNRALFENRTTDADQSVVAFELQVEQMRNDVVEFTREICAPMFQLFDFAEFEPSIYRDIVEKFADGIVT